MYQPTLFVFCCIVLSCAEEYQNSYNKWNKDSDSVINVKSDSIVIQPSRFSNQYSREARVPYIYRRYAFKPRAIPITDQPQVDSTNYYTDTANRTEILFPGNYLPIAKEKSGESDTQFQSKAIPIIRSNEYQRRSLDVDEPIIEKPEGLSEESVASRSLSYIFGADADEDDDYGEYEEEDSLDEERKKGGKKKKKIKPKKLKKYMLPLLLAYKMKYFALIPVLISGLVLLIGATGLAGFFFALFAAVMGLQKGGY